MGYVELHCRSAFSFLEGASLPEELVATAAAHNLGGMALLDRDGVYGCPRFHLEAKKHGIKAHVGAEVTIANAKARGVTREIRYSLLATSRVGYQNLCRLITRYKLREKQKGEGYSSPEEVGDFTRGLILLTGGTEGPLAAALVKGGAEEARIELERLIGLFGQGNIYVELQRHFTRTEEARNQAALELARSFNLPVVATNGVQYARAEDREILDAFTAIRHKRTLSTAGRLLAQNSERYLRTAKEMQALFADIPEAIANTLEVSSRLSFTLADLGYEFPKYPLPDSETPDSLLRQLTEEGVDVRYGRNPALYQKAKRQVERELALIAKLKLAGYFLIVWDLVQFCWKNNILIQGRGSAANSAVCYALGITAVDPVGMELLFERFLSEERGEWPDIDLDLPSRDKREQVIQYVYQKYGKHGAAMTANVITYRGRSAAREMGKVLGFDPPTLDRLSGLIGSFEWRGPDDALANQFKQAGFDLHHPRISKYLDLCLRIQDLPRHLGQHSGGMIVCQGQLDSVVPLEPASMPGRVVVQWDKDDCSALGLVKIDLLGLGMMAALEECLKLIPEHYGHTVDLAHLPQNDPLVYEALCRADTIGLFQVESRAQMASLPRNAPKTFYDIVVQVALIRPGPIVGQMTNPYLERRQNRQKVTYPHALLEPVLKRTLGVPLFQEQLLRMAMICANFSGGEAEELRRALGSRRSKQKMREIEIKLRAGMAANGIAAKTQDEIVQFISSFALYGFPESHSASFALLAYASAYLKCHYLAAFTAALLNNQPMGFYSPAVLVRDAQRHGLKVKPIDILQSDSLCTLEHHGTDVILRLGLNYVRGLRQGVAAAMVERRRMRAFRTIDELKHRVPELSEAELSTLAEIGALNALNGGTHRRDALWQVARAARPAGPLLRGIEEDTHDSPLHKMTLEERLIADYDGTGLTTGRHPMSYRRAELNAMKVIRAQDLHGKRNKQFVRIAGNVIVRQRPGTAKGLIFISLEDETGIANAVVMPDVYEKYRLAILRESYLLIEGELQNKDSVITVKAEHIQPLEVSAAATESHDFH
ncbi:MAG TPA: error-prone DNA polymerase [Alphaproteobacteria bacterium]|nr:error-prone DNA polymerase [Alphaproteobacteria bacterium]